MITDEQGREWLLQKFYDEGWMYLVTDKYDNLYLTNEKPTIYDDGDEIRISICRKYIGITAINKFFFKLKINEYIDIAEELGIVDWLKVPVDTPIKVRNTNEGMWKYRHFAKYKGGKVYSWCAGKTSWSNVASHEPVAWDCAELAHKE